MDARTAFYSPRARKCERSQPDLDGEATERRSGARFLEVVARAERHAHAPSSPLLRTSMGQHPSIDCNVSSNR